MNYIKTLNDKHTITKHCVCPAGHGVSLGSYEYLVYEKVFVAVAAEFGLQPITDYASRSGGPFQAQYHEHRPLSDLLEQVHCSCVAYCH